MCVRAPCAHPALPALASTHWLVEAAAVITTNHKTTTARHPSMSQQLVQKGEFRLSQSHAEQKTLHSRSRNRHRAAQHQHQHQRRHNSSSGAASPRPQNASRPHAAAVSCSDRSGGHGAQPHSVHATAHMVRSLLQGTQGHVTCACTAANAAVTASAVYALCIVHAGPVQVCMCLVGKGAPERGTRQPRQPEPMQGRKQGRRGTWQCTGRARAGSCNARRNRRGSNTQGPKPDSVSAARHTKIEHTLCRAGPSSKYARAGVSFRRRGGNAAGRPMRARACSARWHCGSDASWQAGAAPRSCARPGARCCATVRKRGAAACSMRNSEKTA